jgi:hypothetical protein
VVEVTNEASLRHIVRYKICQERNRCIILADIPKNMSFCTSV